MGQAMAQRLLAAGFPLSVYNRTQRNADDLVAAGARRALTPADAVTPGGIVITMVANDAALEAVTIGAGGFLERLGRGGIHLSMSTIGPDLAGRLDAAQSALDSHYLAAPVFGRPNAAAAGALSIALSGDERAKERVKPVLAALGKGVYDFGSEPSAAHTVKIGGNFLIAAAIESLSEAFALMAKNGIDRAAFHNLLASTLFDCPIYRNYGSYILSEQFSPPGFTLELGNKDIELALAAGKASLAPMPLASLIHDRMLAGLAKGRGDLDWTAISLQALEDAGIGPKH
jgi:3-hydroxyisobutyrate dehydrogenase-like beta-hydroxyacid dehydrogenase